MGKHDFTSYRDEATVPSYSAYASFLPLASRRIATMTRDRAESSLKRRIVRTQSERQRSIREDEKVLSLYSVRSRPENLYESQGPDRRGHKITLHENPIYDELPCESVNHFEFYPKGILNRSLYRKCSVDELDYGEEETDSYESYDSYPGKVPSSPLIKYRDIPLKKAKNTLRRHNFRDETSENHGISENYGELSGNLVPHPVKSQTLPRILYETELSNTKEERKDRKPPKRKRAPGQLQRRHSVWASGDHLCSLPGLLFHADPHLNDLARSSQRIINDLSYRKVRESSRSSKQVETLLRTPVAPRKGADIRIKAEMGGTVLSIDTKPKRVKGKHSEQSTRSFFMSLLTSGGRKG